MQRDLKENVVVITGAGRGVGRAMAISFAEAGADLILASRTESELLSVAAEVESMGRKASIIVANVSRESDAQSIAAEAERIHGRVDVLINNAAIFGGGPVATLDTKSWNRLIAVNLTGTFLVTRAILPLMIPNEKGTNVMIASTSGKRGDPGESAYSASKFGMIGFAQSLTGEVRQHNIRVVIVDPSGVDTRAVPPGQKQAEGKGIRLCAEDVAETVLHTVLLPGRAMVREVELWATNP